MNLAVIIVTTQAKKSTIMVPLAEEIKKEMIMDQLVWNESINPTNIEVKVEKNIVELWGSVQNMTAKLAAERDTYLVPGISNVKNHLEIKFPPDLKVPNDRQIEQYIREMLDWNDEIMASHIHVKCNNHVVTSIASFTSGVRDVVDEINFA